MSLKMVMETYMHTNVFIYVHISTFITSNVDSEMHCEDGTQAALDQKCVYIPGRLISC